MKKNSALRGIVILHLTLLFLSGCKIFKETGNPERILAPNTYGSFSTSDTLNTSIYNWKLYFNDPNLEALIDTALNNNQELNIMQQEIIARWNEVRIRKGEYLPLVKIGSEIGVEKAGRYTRNGAVEDNLEIDHGISFPEPLSDFQFGFYAQWELDIWKKLRNAKKSAFLSYLGSEEGKNFLITNLVAEISESYYELIALDNLLKIIEHNIVIQKNALYILKQQKEAAKVTQLAVNRFEAQVLNTINLQFEIHQKFVETENRINFLAGRFPHQINRNSADFMKVDLSIIHPGLPSQLLYNRPDIRNAEFELAASKLDVKIAKAHFFPEINLRSGLGIQAFNPTLLFYPQSLIYSIAGDLISPLINRNAIKAVYLNANAKQLQSVYHYERSILNAYIEVYNQLSKVENLKLSFDAKSKEVDLLIKSIDISNGLFNSARADYMEVLLTQRDALYAQMELVDIHLHQLQAKVSLYKALGGGWR